MNADVDVPRPGQVGCHDIGELQELSESMPEKVMELTEMLHAWHGAVDARMPRADTEER